jgi:ribosomal protein L40E
MSDKIRCPRCGALNPAGAEWCNQCLAVFHAPEPEPPPAAVEVPQAEPQVEATVAAPVTARAESSVQVEVDTGQVDTGQVGEAQDDEAQDDTGQPAAPVVATPVQHGAFSVSAAGITWTCPICETVNPLSASICDVCGATFAEALGEKKPELPNKDPNTAALVSFILPGAGHAYLGLWGQAIARGIFGLWALLVVVISTASDQTGTKTIAVVFGLVTLVLWVLGAHDAFREARHEPGQVVLKGKVYLYLMLGLLMLLMVLLMVTSMRQT